MNPVDWAAWLYGRFLSTHPILSALSYFVVPLAGAGLALLVWMRAVDKYWKENPKPAHDSQPLTAGPVPQSAASAERSSEVLLTRVGHEEQSSPLSDRPRDSL